MKFGNANASICGIINCWTFNVEVAVLAHKENCNLILSHESLYVPYGIVDVIECSHEISENRGIAKLGNLLREELGGMKIVDY